MVQFWHFIARHIRKQLPAFALNVKQFNMEISIEAHTAQPKEFHISHLMRSRGGDGVYEKTI